MRKYLELILGWLLFVVVLFFSVGGPAIGNYWSLIPSVIVAALVLPPFRRWLKGKRIPLPGPIGMILITFALLVLLTNVMHHGEWSRDRERIVSEIRSDLESGDFDSVLEEAEKWKRFSDTEIIDLSNSAQRQKDELSRQSKERVRAEEAARAEGLRLEKIRELEAFLANNERKSATEVYETFVALQKLDPSNAGYANAVQEYQQDFEREQAELQAVALRERNLAQSKEWTRCDTGIFGPTVVVNGLGVAAYEYELNHDDTADYVRFEILEATWDIAKACSNAKSLEVRIHVRGLVDRFGNPVDDQTGTILLDLELARKFVHRSGYVYDDAVRTFYGIALVTSPISRFVGK